MSLSMGFYPSREALQKSLGFETLEKQPTDYQHYGTTIGLSIVLTVLGVYIRSLGKVYALVGGVAATTLAYILPAAAYLATRSIRDPIQDEAKTALLQHSSRLSYHSVGESSTTSDTPIEEEPVVVDLDEGPACWYLDAAAGLLILWGLVVMFFATKNVFSQ
jgi:sodium-coupled neutral amino acid transporter 11